MPDRRPFAARIAGLSFAALGTGVLGAWGGAAVDPSLGTAGAAAGLAVPFVVAAAGRVRRRGTGRPLPSPLASR